jgi:hypothetical protein
LIITYTGNNIYAVTLIKGNAIVDSIDFLPSGRGNLIAASETMPDEFDYVLSFEPHTKRVIYFANPLLETHI